MWETRKQSCFHISKRAEKPERPKRFHNLRKQPCFNRHFNRHIVEGFRRILPAPFLSLELIVVERYDVLNSRCLSTYQQESGRLRDTTYDQLRGNLMAYESTILKDDQQELRKEESVALKMGTINEEDKSSIDPDEDKEMAILTRKLYNF
ncbi:uncharacterized protein G2W53_032947 [Senna tora]|uniref:Uncharacterized protein n=1 Tax=Senna tora TaxID=362788 RepID=A0A834WAL7_9FABA|nr:uncharacterized protein G2W53_032947 [Senna tora]